MKIKEIDDTNYPQDSLLAPSIPRCTDAAPHLMRSPGVWKSLLTLMFIAVGCVISSLGHNAHAASLNYSADTSVTLTSPAVTLTIKAGSVADQFVVNTGN